MAYGKKASSCDPLTSLNYDIKLRFQVLDAFKGVTTGGILLIGHSVRLPWIPTSLS